MIGKIKNIKTGQTKGWIFMQRLHYTQKQNFQANLISMISIN